MEVSWSVIQACLMASLGCVCGHVRSQGCAYAARVNAQTSSCPGVLLGQLTLIPNCYPLPQGTICDHWREDD